MGISLLWAQYPQVREKVKNLPQFDDRFVHYGYFVGVNNYFFDFNYDLDYYRTDFLPDIEVTPSTGFTIGLIGDMRINQFMNLRLEPDFITPSEIFFILTQKDLKQKMIGLRN